MGKFSELKEKQKAYNKKYAELKDYMDKNHAGWEKTKDATHIKMRLNQAAKVIIENQTKQKTKIVKKSEYKGEWPFSVDKVTIIQTSKLWISCMIKDKEYALNGLAKEAMPWLKFVHDAKKAIKGIDIGPFIRIGQAL